MSHDPEAAELIGGQSVASLVCCSLKTSAEPRTQTSDVFARSGG